MKDVLKTFGSMILMVIRIILIIFLGVTGVIALGSVLFFPFVWEGAIRLGIGIGCGGLMFLIIRMNPGKGE